MKPVLSFFLLLIFAVIFVSCANQLPPPGGESDKNPPKIISVYPKPNTVNFKGDKITLRFDEYVDRRSLEESFYISPLPKGKINFSWSGREVEISFSKPLTKNVTYQIMIGKDLKDIREGNVLGTQYKFAFSTGPRIDKGMIQGKIIADNIDRVKIFAYKTGGMEINPEKDQPEYIVQSNDSGNYSLSNLADGRFRLFAVIDEDRNNIYNKDVDRISVLSEDINLNPGNKLFSGADFILTEFEIIKTGYDFLRSLKPDSAEFIYSNIRSNETNIPPDYKFYFHFKNIYPEKSETINSFSVYDSSEMKSYKLIFNWITDSLLEVFSTEKFKFSSELYLSIKTVNKVKDYSYSQKFKISDKNKTGSIEGKIVSSEKINEPVFLRLINKENKLISYFKKLTDTAEFSFTDLPEGNYELISFIDANENGIFDKGNHFPFDESEKISVYEKTLDIKGGWNIDNVFIKY